jgi:hypothetical protein
MVLRSDVEAEAMSTSCTAECDYQLLSAIDARIFLNVRGRVVDVFTSKIRAAVAERGNNDLCPDLPDTKPLALVRLFQAEFKAPLAMDRSRLNVTESNVEAALDSALKEWRSSKRRVAEYADVRDRLTTAKLSWTRGLPSARTTLA